MKTLILILLPILTYSQQLEPLFRLPAADPEAWQTHTYTIKSGNTGSYFIISQNGTVYVKRTAYETFVQKRTWKLTFSVQDDGIMKSKEEYFLTDKQTTLKQITVTLRKSNLQYLKPIFIDTATGDTLQSTVHNIDNGGDGMAVVGIRRTYTGGLAGTRGCIEEKRAVQTSAAIRCGAVKSALELAN